MKIKKSSFILLLLIAYSLIIPFLRILYDFPVSISLLLSLISDLIIICIFVLLINCTLIKFQWFDLLVVLFVIVCLMSGINITLLNNYPELYFYGLHMTVLPIILYFGSRYSFVQTNTLVDIIWKIGLIHVVISILSYEPLNHMVPFINKYSALLSSILRTSVSDNWGLMVRMRSVLDSLTFGNIVGTTTLISYYYFLIEGKLRFCFFTFLAFLTVILSFQRSALIGVLISLFLIFYLIQTEKKIVKTITIASALLASFITSLLLPQEIRSYLFFRLNDIITGGHNAIMGRLDQWSFALEIVTNHPFGIGIGQVGHKAVNFLHTDQFVADGNYLKVLAETGVLGLGIFLAILLYVLLKAYKHWKSQDNYNHLLLAILVFYMIQAIGTNVWDLYYSASIFWLFLGCYFRPFCTHEEYRFKK